MGDAGLTGRKIIVDTYGGMARHGGGAFSGKDPSKVDRSAAYAMRWVAKNIVAAGLARRAEVQVAYAIGKAQPVGVFVQTFGTGVVADEVIQKAVLEVFDLRPAAIIRDLDLLRPIYAQTSAYGHFGRELPDFTWETHRPGRRAARLLRASEGLHGFPGHPGKPHVWQAIHRPTSVRIAGRHLRRPASTARACRPAVKACAVTSGRGGPAGAAPGAGRVKAEARKAKPPKEKKPVARAEVDPVARVLVDVPLAHLDRPFDYAVPETMADDAQPGVRVKVRFAGQDVDGFVIERAATTEHTGRLQPLRRVVSPERVLTPDVAALTGAVAARYAGTRSDVLRLAVPPRHATVEKQPSEPAPADRRASRGPSWLAHYPGGRSRPGGAGGRGVAARRLDGRPGRRLGRRCSPRPWSRPRASGPGRAGLRPRPPRRRPARRGAHRAAGRGPPRRARGRRRPGQALPRVPRDQPRGGAHRHRHPRRRVRAGAGPRAGGDLGRRRRPPRRAAGAVPPCPRGAAHARPGDRVRGRAGGARAQRRGGVPPPHRLGRRGRGPARRRTPAHLGRPHRRLRPRPRSATPARARPGCPARRSRLLRDAVQRRTGARADAARRLRDPAGLRPLPYAGPVRRLPRTAPPPRTVAPARVRLVRHRGPRLALPRVRRTGPARARARRRPHRRGARPCPARRAGAHVVLGRPRARRRSTTSPAIVVATPGAEPVAAGGYAAVRAARHLAAARPARTCAPPRRPYAAGPTPPRWCARRATAGGCSRSGTPRHPGLQALVRWDPGGLARREIDERQSAHLPPASRVATVTGEPGRPRAGAGRAAAARRAPRCWARSRSRAPGRPRRGARCATSSASRAPRAPRCPRRSASCRRSARPASCRTCGSRWTPPSSGDRLSQLAAYVRQHDRRTRERARRSSSPEARSSRVPVREQPAAAALHRG